MRLFTVLMKQTRQAVCAVKQSIFLDIYDLQRHRGILLPSAKTGSPSSDKVIKNFFIFVTFATKTECGATMPNPANRGYTCLGQGALTFTEGEGSVRLTSSLR